MNMLLQLAVGSTEQVVKTHLANAKRRLWLREDAAALLEVVNTVQIQQNAIKLLLHNGAGCFFLSTQPPLLNL